MPVRGIAPLTCAKVRRPHQDAEALSRIEVKKRKTRSALACKAPLFFLRSNRAISCFYVKIF